MSLVSIAALQLLQPLLPLSVPTERSPFFTTVNFLWFFSPLKPFFYFLEEAYSKK
jgi:hypothetical protein